MLLLPGVASAAPTVSPPVDLSAAGQSAYGPVVAVSADGATQTVTWRRFDSVKYRVQVATSIDSGVTWSAGVDLSAAGQHASNPKVVVSADGTIQTATWYRYDGTKNRVQVTSLTNSTVSTAPTSPAAVGGDSSVLVSWTAPVDDGGAAITGYTVTASPGGSGCATLGLSCTITDLNPATEYTVSVTATNSAGQGSAAQVSATTLHGFADVPASGWRNDAVTWMRKSGVTVGCSATEFCPDAQMTREQQITFLWRYAGEPSPGPTSQFLDVPAGRYYTNPINWAYNNGTTVGIRPTWFGTGRLVTRAQAMTFLWRQAGEPTPTVPNPFSDVPQGTYYMNPVRWAYENGITSGITPTTFAPNQPVTRIEFAAFLFRYDNLN